MHNLFADIPALLANELTETLATGTNVRIERIVSTGHASDADFWYDQPETEWVVVLKGAARLRFSDGEEQKLGPGDYLLIPAHRKHRVEWTSAEEPTVWLAVLFS